MHSSYRGSLYTEWWSHRLVVLVHTRLHYYTTVAHAPVIAPFYCKQGPRRLLCVCTYDLTEFGCLSFNSSWLSLDMEESSSCSLTMSSPSGSEPLRSVRAFLFMVELESSLVSETRVVESQLPIFSSHAPDCCQSPIKSTIDNIIDFLHQLRIKVTLIQICKITCSYAAILYTCYTMVIAGWLAAVLHF